VEVGDALEEAKMADEVEVRDQFEIGTRASGDAVPILAGQVQGQRGSMENAIRPVPFGAF